MVDYKQLRSEVEVVRSSVKNLLDFFTNRTLKDLKTRRRSKEFDIIDFNKRENPNIMKADDFFCVFREEVGVYLFEANFSVYYENWFKEVSDLEPYLLKEKWFEEFIRLWSGVDKSPAFYKSRAQYHYLSDQHNKFRDNWVPLYVGKSKNVQGRVFEHIEGVSLMTYGMKLSHRETLKKDIQFRVSYSPLNELEDDVLFELVKVIENKVRADLNPIIGKHGSDLKMIFLKLYN
jgi:hypothetical protein